MRLGSFGIISYRSTIREPGRVRFTIAHELGHWELHADQTQAQLCTAGDVSGYKGSPMEIEANAFAAELLMPTPMVADILRYASPTFEFVRKISGRFGTSLTASAIRLVEQINYPAIVVFSENNRVTWCNKSPKANHLFLERGSPISADTSAWNCMTEPDEMEAPEAVDAHAWFSNYRYSDRLSIEEQSVVLGDYGITMTLLSIDEN